MKSPSSPVVRDIVLVGGGHSHVGVLKHFGMQPEPGVRLTVICTDVHTPYSGMLPGYVAGHYSYDDVHIDLGRLAVFAGARLFRDEVIGIDRMKRQVICKNRPPVAYDVLSINIGSTPQLKVSGSELAVPVKPINQFNTRWLSLLARVQQHERGPLRIAVVGGGAGGVELLLAMQHRLRAELKARQRDVNLLQFALLHAGPQILPTHNPRVRRRFEQVLRARGVQVHLNAEVTRVARGLLICKDGQQVDADEIMWVTQAAGAPWLQDTGLSLDKEGFLSVLATLQVANDPRVFAAGDVAAMTQHRLEKAGVFAVRMGPVLAENLRSHVRGLPLGHYIPQKHWLALISTGDRVAVASRHWWSVSGAWVWRWKDWIDRRFMRKYSEFPQMHAGDAPATASPRLQMSQEESLQAISAIAMRCGGCGAKVGATVLSRALGQLQVVERDDVIIGLKDPDDAAVVRVPPGKALVHSVDFFRAFIDDPYLFGRIAANHALGDIFAMGAQAQSATAIATVPPGLEAKVEDLLFQMMTGAVEVLNDAGCALVGGHTGEGSELALGFAVNGLIDEDSPDLMRKGGMKPGDVLILTKPIGTGTLFAAHARLAAKGRWIDAALSSMAMSNRVGSEILRAHAATACTDLTGFGLLGHLVEMTRPSEVDAELNLAALPLLDGAIETVAAGIVSSLQPANVRLRRALRNQEAFVNHPRYPLLFDPQTAGGLLASVPAANVQACVAALRAAGYVHTAIIGRVLPVKDDFTPVTLVDQVPDLPAQ